MSWFDNLRMKSKIFMIFSVPLIVQIIIGTTGIIHSNGIQSEQWSFYYFVWEIVSAVSISLVMGFLMYHTTSKPFIKVLKTINEIEKGHLDFRLNFSRKDEIGLVANTLDHFAESLKKNIVKSMRRISEGDFSIKITPQDDKDEITPMLNKIATILNELKVETDLFNHAYSEGKTDFKGNADKFTGGYKEIIEGINKTVNGIISVIRSGYLIMQKLTDGDLTARLDNDFKGNYNRYKDYINNLGGSLHNLVAEVATAIDSTENASKEISSSVEEMAAGAEEQSQQTSEIASAVEEMTRTILDNTQSATHAAETAKESGIKAKQGGEVVKETVEGMIKIADVVKKSAATVSALGKSSDQIGEIVQVIDDIADQTNLLALNAAIEAARAGDQGRGFAVVADEVRKLAERTTKATKEIEVMIKKIQKDTNDAVLSMKQGTKEVDKGRELAGKAGEVLGDIITGAEQTSDIVAQVAAASEEQSSAAEQIGKNIDAISTVTQQSVQGIQKIAQSSENLIKLTQNLENIVKKFHFNNSPGKTLSGININQDGKLNSYKVTSPHNGNGNGHSKLFGGKE
ncbi:MAG TPA: methyl-accepting chemotaxis protein [Ignavibacteriaceae bacterium]|nr:methyl-accepting chemotaxis protein [Ignavibacteriaceae bacterium]